MDILSEFEKELRQVELTNHKIDQAWRENVNKPEAQQEVVRRGIEALYTAAKVGELMAGDDAKIIREEVGTKLVEFIKKLKPIN